MEELEDDNGPEVCQSMVKVVTLGKVELPHRYGNWIRWDYNYFAHLLVF